MTETRRRTAWLLFLALSLVAVLESCGPDARSGSPSSYRATKVPAAGELPLSEILELMDSTPSEPKTISGSMDFRHCSRFMDELHARAWNNVRIVDTSLVRMTKLRMDEGSLLVTCSEADKKIAVTRSPHWVD